MASTLNASTSSGLISSGDTSGILQLQTANTTALTVDGSQNVGIGTTSPTNKLTVSSGATGTAAAFSGSGTFSEISFKAGASTTAYIGVNNADVIVEAGGSERMRIDSSGNVGIGTSTINASLQIYKSGASASSAYFTNGTTTTSSGFQVGLDSGSNAVLNMQYNAQMLFSTNNTERMRIDTSGNLLVGATNISIVGGGTGFAFSPNFQSVSGNGTLYVGNSASTNSQAGINLYSTGASAYRFYVGMGGTVFATNTTITAISDQRLKENIRDLDEGLATVMALKPRKFDWKSGKGADIKNARGFIAQEFETVLPDMIEEWRDPAPEGEEPYKAINANLIPTLVKAIQEQQALITAQAETINALTARIVALEK